MMIPEVQVANLVSCLYIYTLF